eukprot:gene5746-6039_t
MVELEVKQCRPRVKGVSPHPNPDKAGELAALQRGESERQVSSLTTAIGLAQTEQAELQKNIKEQGLEMAKLREALAGQCAESAKLKSQLSQKDDELAMAKCSLGKKLEEAEKKLTTQDATIYGLQKELQDTCGSKGALEHQELQRTYGTMGALEHQVKDFEVNRNRQNQAFHEIRRLIKWAASPISSRPSSLNG